MEFFSISTTRVLIFSVYLINHNQSLSIGMDHFSVYKNGNEGGRYRRQGGGGGGGVVFVDEPIGSGNHR